MPAQEFKNKGGFWSVCLVLSEKEKVNLLTNLVHFVRQMKEGFWRRIKSWSYFIVRYQNCFYTLFVSVMKANDKTFLLPLLQTVSAINIDLLSSQISCVALFLPFFTHFPWCLLTMPPWNQHRITTASMAKFTLMTSSHCHAKCEKENKSVN